MKRAFILVFSLLLLLVACAQTPQTGTQVKPSDGNEPGKDINSPLSVQISGFKFTPSEITIKVGETVTWTNQDSAPHTVTSDLGNELGSNNLGRGQFYSHTFSQAGTFEYHCGVHPGMKAKVIVE